MAETQNTTTVLSSTDMLTSLASDTKSSATTFLSTTLPPTAQISTISSIVTSIISAINSTIPMIKTSSLTTKNGTNTTKFVTTRPFRPIKPYSDDYLTDYITVSVGIFLFFCFLIVGIFIIKRMNRKPMATQTVRYMNNPLANSNIINGNDYGYDNLSSNSSASVRRNNFTIMNSISENEVADATISNTASVNSNTNSNVKNRFNENLSFDMSSDSNVTADKPQSNQNSEILIDLNDAKQIVIDKNDNNNPFR